MYSPGRGDARATALPNARDSSTSMPIDHSSAWQREPYNRDVRLDRGDRDRIIGGKREWNSDRATPGAPYQRGFGGLHPVNGNLGPPNKRRLNGRHSGFHTENRRYGSAGYRGEPPFGSIVPLDNGLARKLDRDSFYPGSGCLVANTSFSSGPGLDHRSKELEEKLKLGSFLPSGDGRDAGVSGGHDQHGRPFPVQVLTEVENTSWERERSKGVVANGWESSQRSERDHRDRFLGKAESYSRREGKLSQFEGGKDSSQLDKDLESNKLDRCGSSSWDSYCCDTVSESKVSVHGSDCRRKERSTSDCLSRNVSHVTSNGGIKESVLRSPGLDVSGRASSPHRSPQSKPPSAVVEVSRDESNHPSPPKRPRLGWGQGLAKYEKKKVGETDENVVSGSVGSVSWSAKSSITSVISGPTLEVLQAQDLQAAEESSVSIVSKLATSPFLKPSASLLPQTLESMSKSCSEGPAIAKEELEKFHSKVANEVEVTAVPAPSSAVQAEDLISHTHLCPVTDCSLDLSVLHSDSCEPVERPAAFKESISCQASPAAPSSIAQSYRRDLTQEVCSSGPATWWSKEDILQTVEKLESEIEQVERELAKLEDFGRLQNDTYIPVPETFQDSADADTGTKLECEDNGHQVMREDAVDLHAGSTECGDSPQPILASSPNRICSVSVECISRSVSGLGTGGALEEGPDMCNEAMGDEHRCMESEAADVEEGQLHAGKYEVTSDQAVVESEGERSLVSSPSAEVYLAHTTHGEQVDMEVGVSKAEVAEKESAGAGMEVGDVEAVARGLIRENKDRARHASEPFLRLLSEGGRAEGKVYSCPAEAPVWKENVDRHVRNQEKMLEKIAERRQCERFVEQALAMKFRALRDAWKQEQFGASQQQKGTKPVRRWEAEKRGGVAACHRSSLRLRPVQAGGGKAEAQSEECMKKVMVEAAVGPLRPVLRMPAMIVGERERLARRFESNNALVEDPVRVELERKNMNPWSAEERRIFVEKFAVYNKNFSKIASHLEYKTTADCVEFYYRNQKSEDFEKIRRRQQLKKRRDYSRVGGSFLSTGLQSNSRQREASVDARSEAWNMQTSGGVSTVCQVAVGAKAARSSKPLERQRTSSSLDPGSLPAVVEVAKSVSGRESRPSGIPPLPSSAAGCGSTGLCGLSYATVASVKVSRERTSMKSNWSGGSVVARSGTKEQNTSGPKGARSAHIRRGLATSAGEEADAQWTDKERELFTEAVSLVGKDFEKIAAHVGTTKSVGQCKSFFSKTRKRLRLDQLVEKYQASLNCAAAAAVAESPERVDVQMEEASIVAAEGVAVSRVEENVSTCLEVENDRSDAVERVKAEEVAKDVSVEASAAAETETCEDVAAEEAGEVEACEDVVVAEAMEEEPCEDVAVEKGAEDVTGEKGVEEVSSEAVGVEEAAEDESVEGKAGEDGRLEVKAAEEDGMVGRVAEDENVKDVVEEDGTVDDGAGEGEVGVSIAVGAVDDGGVWKDATVESVVGPPESPEIVENVGEAEADVGAGACSMNECDTGEAEEVVGACVKAESVDANEGVGSEALAVDAGEEVPGGKSPAGPAECGMQEEGGAVEGGKSGESVVGHVKKEVDADEERGVGTVVTASIRAAEEQAVEASGTANVKHEAGSPQVAVSTGTESGSFAVGGGGVCHSGKAGSASTSSVQGSQQCREKSGKVGSGEAKPRREPTSWTQEEKEVFADIIRNYGKDWTRLHECLPAKSLTQIKTYFQNSKAKLGLVNSEGMNVSGGRGSGGRKRKAEEAENTSSNIGSESKLGCGGGGDVDGGGGKVKGGVGDVASMSASAGMGTIPVGLEGLVYPFFGQRSEEQMALHKAMRQMQLCNPNGFPQNIPPVLYPLLQQQGMAMYPNPGLQRAGHSNLQQQFAASLSQKASQSMGLQLAMQGAGVGQQGGGVDLHQQGAHQLQNTQAVRNQQQLLANMMQQHAAAQQAAAQLQQQQQQCGKGVVHPLQQVVVLQPGQVAQRQQQQHVSSQRVHISQGQQGCHVQPPSSAHLGGSDSLVVNHAGHLSYHLKQLHEQQQQQAFVQQPQRAAHLVQKQQQHNQHEMIESNSQGLVHQHQNSLVSLFSSAGVPKANNVMIPPQQSSATFSSSLLQQGGSMHRQDQQQHGVSKALLSGIGGSTFLGDGGEVSNHNGELCEMRENGGNEGAGNAREFSRADLNQLSSAVQRVKSLKSAVLPVLSSTSATESPQNRPGDVKLFGQSLLSQPTCSGAPSSAVRASLPTPDKAILRESAVYTSSSSPVTSISTPAATGSKAYGKETSFNGVPFMPDDRQTGWHPSGYSVTTATRNGLRPQMNLLWKSKEGESELHSTQDGRMSRETRSADSEQNVPTATHKLYDHERSRSNIMHSRSETLSSINSLGDSSNEQSGGFPVSSVEGLGPDHERRNESTVLGTGGCERGSSMSSRGSRGQLDSFATQTVGSLANGSQIPRTVMNALMAFADLQSRNLQSFSSIGSPRLEDHQWESLVRQAAQGAVGESLKAHPSLGRGGPSGAPHLSGGDLLQQCVRDGGMYFTQHYPRLASQPGVSPSAWNAGTGLLSPSDVQRMLVNPAFSSFIPGVLSRAPSAAEEHLGSTKSRDPDNGGGGPR